MYRFQRSQPNEILFEDQVTLSDGRSKPYLVLLQLTAESLIIRPRNTISTSPLNNKEIQTVEPRHVIIGRNSITRSFGFSIKGGSDTGFPILISRVLDINAHLLNIGDAIFNINNEDISNLTHNQVISKLRDARNNQVNLTIKYMNNMATYLRLTSHKFRPSISILQNYLTTPNILSNRMRRDQKARSAIYSYEHHSYAKQKDLPLAISEKLKNTDDSIVNITDKFRKYSLLYAYVSQYINGTDECRINAFQLHTRNGSQTGIIITDTAMEQNMWISRINIVIQNLTARLLAELNQTLVSCEQLFYATWIHERIIYPNENHLPEWQAIFIVFKGTNMYIFDRNPSPPLCNYDFICCTCVYPLIEIFIGTVTSKCSTNDRRYCIKLALPNHSTNKYRLLSLERKEEYDNFILNYQRSLHMSVYSIQTRTFGCIYQGQICRLTIDINKGFEMCNNQTNIILWAFTFEQLQSSSDNGHDKIYLQFKFNIPLNNNETIIDVNIQCQHLRILVHVINAFLTAKFISRRDHMIDRIKMN
ncbi:unnamed protein product [Rotaria magnacalcarata]|uniref:PDZ domain-containing protein n=1 Tax=Rotaria magnacalcarata TaxID=392030 RepID=A0A819K930_9BILA|nr:unnamed protein product [Rotaria magnacalcarata]CAF3946116.1 unnamed protein product [Rotaria magnacalcarata]